MSQSKLIGWVLVIVCGLCFIAALLIGLEPCGETAQSAVFFGVQTCGQTVAETLLLILFGFVFVAVGRIVLRKDKTKGLVFGALCLVCGIIALVIDAVLFPNQIGSGFWPLLNVLIIVFGAFSIWKYFKREKQRPRS